MELPILISVGVFGALLGAGLGFALGRYVWPSVPAIDPTALALARNEVGLREQECIALQSRVEELNIQCTTAAAETRTAREEVARLTERVTSLNQRVKDQETFIGTAESQRKEAAAKLMTAAAQVAQLTEREKALTEKVTEQTQQLADMQQRLTTEFENIASRILKTSATDLSDSSQKTLGALLEPLRERLHEFQQKVENTYDSERREVLSLKEEIRRVVETSHTVGSQADGLVKALRGDAQRLGRWGELALERILEAAGLREGREYVAQGRGLKLKADDGGVQRPDIIVMLPEQRTLIVDSKVPLASYERLIAAGDDAERALCCDQFVYEVKRHIEGLSGKRYQENPRLQAHDCALMFVPIEGALAAALTSDPELFTYAWDRGVVLVGPPTLLMTMRTVASIWRYERQGQNAQEISRLAGELCDKLSMSLVDLNTVAEKINAAADAHGAAVKRLSTGKGNALSIGERMRSLGVKTRREVPAMLVDGVPVAIAVDAENALEVEGDANPTEVSVGPSQWDATEFSTPDDHPGK
jgi:DNA recombination protein RmuC